jgi:hypothetical protein
MKRNKGPLPSRLFWSTYKGMVVLGLAGAVIGTTLGTAMLIFRGTIEPWMPLAINVVLSLASKHWRHHLTYDPAAYPWIVGYVYALGTLWVGAIGLAAYWKPSSDRRLDAYLMRKQALENKYVSSVESRRSPD